MSKPFATALIDTYNHEEFIAEAINSILEQDFSPSEMEILVVDDGSTDKTPEIVRKFAPRVRMLRKSNGGQASAFNAGIPEARGEIVAFLDGDDWWAPNKLRSVSEALRANPEVGLVGHGITEVHQDGRRRTELPRETYRFRLNSVAEAKTFRLSRGFLGTSRMAYRKELLGRIGVVPEALRFEADEYLFTLAGWFAEVMILPEALTYYRLHDRNLFQTADGNAQAVRAKQKVLGALATSLRAAFQRNDVPGATARVILECVQAEADVLRLEVDGGWPWETVATELKILEIFHGDASASQHLFSYLRILPAAVMPARAYYRWRHQLSRMNWYQKFRRRVMPFPVPNHVERREG
jgi:glycosyltransferase involved in cell wall biosynthesis